MHDARTTARVIQEGRIRHQMAWLRRVSDPNRQGSLAHKFREDRYVFLRRYLEGMPRPIRILDIGGTVQFWQQSGLDLRADVDITVCNISEPEVKHPDLTFVKADACDLQPFDDNQFDLAFSNSVIEHVGNFERMRAMADEVRRVGRCYFIQTPNRRFPTDPHFPFPFFQFLPLALKATLLQWLPLAWVGRIKERHRALEAAGSVQLLNHKQFQTLFPKAKMYRERLLGLTKSFIAYSDGSNQ